MAARRLVVLLVTALMALAAATFSGRASGSENACSTYSYAGFDNSRRGHGIAAHLTALTPPNVAQGHVAAWIGVGGYQLGPHRLTEWLQVGLSAGEGAASSNLYYEVTRPHASARFHLVLPTVAIGEPHGVAVLEMYKRRSWWRVWVDGKPVSEPIFLPGSHGRWEPQALGESWNAGSNACNGYAYRFDRLLYSKHSGGVWRRFRKGVRYNDTGYEPSREHTNGFLAAPSSVVATLAPATSK